MTIADKNTDTGGFEWSNFESLPNKSKNKVFFDLITDAGKRIEALKAKTEEIDKEYKKQSNLNIEILAIFVALFTFVSVEFQIFRSFVSWESGASLSLLLLGSLSFFVILIDFILRDRKTWFLLLFFVPISMLAIGIYYFGQARIIESDYVRINQDLKDMITANEINTKTLGCLNNAGYWRQKCFEN